MTTITLKPQRRRLLPLDGVLKTVVQIGEHEVTFSTNFKMPNPDMQIVWIPGKPENAEFLPQFQRRFERARLLHLQKCADVSQRPVTALTTKTLRELKEMTEHPRGDDDAG